MSRVRCPKVSVGLPVFNGESYVGEAIESILEQSFGTENETPPP